MPSVQLPQRGGGECAGPNGKQKTKQKSVVSCSRNNVSPSLKDVIMLFGKMQSKCLFLEVFIVIVSFYMQNIQNGSPFRMISTQGSSPSNNLDTAR